MTTLLTLGLMTINDYTYFDTSNDDVAMKHG